MKRREFVEISGLAGAGALVSSGVVSRATAEQAIPAAFDPASEHTGRELQAPMAAGALTAVQAVQHPVRYGFTVPQSAFGCCCVTQ